MPSFPNPTRFAARSRESGFAILVGSSVASVIERANTIAADWKTVGGGISPTGAMPA